MPRHDRALVLDPVGIARDPGFGLGGRPGQIWACRQSISIIKELMNGRMYPTTLEVLEGAMRVLAK